MRKLVLKMSMSLDGFVCGPNNEMDWLFRTPDEDSRAWTLESLKETGLHIMGSRTFRDMEAWWPHSQDAYAPFMNEIPKAVFSRSGLANATTTEGLKDAQRRGQTSNVVSPHANTWKEAEILGGDLATEIARLKQQDGRLILAHGGASFAQSLIGARLIDEYRLLIHPCALGNGKALFNKLAAPLRLELLDAQTYSNGTVAHVYRPADYPAHKGGQL